MTITAAVSVILPFFLGAVPQPVSDAKSAADGLAVIAEVDRLAGREIWPGFDLKSVPIALYDGRRTLLYRHPSPPDGFSQAADHPGIWVTDGLYKDVRANTATEIGGALTAVVELDTLRDASSPTDCAAVVAHEAFHVYEMTRHKDWSANEAQLFTYTVENPDLLQMRRLESEALRRGLAADAVADQKRWAALAIRLRAQRFAALGTAGSSYERATEKFEGLAQFVQSEALGRTEGLVRLTPEEFPPAAVRLRSYSTGIAIALLLNRLAPAWKETIESGKPVALDELLAAAVSGVGPAEFTREEAETAAARAREDTAALLAARAKMRADFSARDGWRVTIVAAAGQPLRLQGFDPMNVERLSSREVLHTRWLRLGNQSASLEALNRQSLTLAAGEHPLFSGVAEISVTGLANEPELTSAGDKTTLRAEGFSADFTNAKVSKKDKSLRVELGAQPEK